MAKGSAERTNARHMRTIGLVDGMSWESTISYYRLINEELCVGTIRPESKATLGRIMTRLKERGAQGIILGCTELGLLLDGGDSPVPLFDTTRIHAQAAVDFALRP